MRDQLLARAPKVFAKIDDDLLNLVSQVRDGFEPLGFHASDIGDALRILEEVKSFMAELAAHFVGRLQRELPFLHPREPHGFQQGGILEAGGWPSR